MALGAAAGHPLSGFYAAVVLLTSFEWIRSATSARIDMSLALGTTMSFVGLALFGETRRGVGLFLLYGGMIWGTLAKGPIGIVLPTLCMGVVILVDAGVRWLIGAAALALVAAAGIQAGLSPAAVVGIGAIGGVVLLSLIGLQGIWPMRPLLGYAVVATVTGAWYALAARAGGDEFIRLQILAENFGRFLGTAQVEVGHEHGPFYLLGALAGGFMPWTLFLPPAATMVWRARSAGLGTLLQHCLVWIAVVLGFFTVSSSKRSVYLLPLYPAASLLVGSWLARVVTVKRARPVLRGGLQTLGLAAILVGGAIAVFFALQASGFDLLGTVVTPILEAETGAEGAALFAGAFDARASVLATFAAGLALAGTVLVGCASARRWNASIAALFAVVFILLALTQRAVMPAVAAGNTRRPLAERLRRVAHGREVMTAPELEYGLTFYMGGALPVLGDADETDTAVIVVPRSVWLGWTAERRQQYEPITSLAVPKHNNQVPLVALQRVHRDEDNVAAPEID